MCVFPQFCNYVICVYIPNEIINIFYIPATVEGKHWCLKCPVKSPQSKVVVWETFTDGLKDRCLPLSVDPQLLCSQYFWTRLWHTIKIVHKNDVITELKGSQIFLLTLLGFKRNVVLNEQSTQSLNLFPLLLEILCEKIYSLSSDVISCFYSSAAII